MQSAFTQGILQTPLDVTLGGTGLASLGSALQVIRVNAAGTALEYAASSGTGTVTSVDITLPTGLVVTGNPITTSGTLAIDTDIGYVIPLQSSIDEKAPLISPTFDTSINASFATASTVPYFDASKNIISSAVTPTELGYLSGVTSAIQTQLNAKQASDTQLTSLASLSFTGNALKVVRVNAGETDFELASISGAGDVVGPASATDNAIVLFDGTSGKLVKNSASTISSGVIVTASVQPTAGVLAGSSAQTTTTAAAGQLFGSTSTFYQLGTGGITATLTADFNAAGTLLRQSTFTEAATGTHALIANLAIRSPIITNGSGATTNAVTLYVEGAPTGTASPTNVYSAWFDAGEVRIDGDIGDTTNRTAKVWATNIESTNMPTVGGTSLSSTFAALAGSTGQVFSVSSLELGNTDTTLSRSSAGIIAVEGVVVPTVSSTSTLSNKRIDPRVVSGTSYTTSTTIDSDTTDLYVITAQAGALLFNNPSGTPVQGQKLMVRIKDNGTARALTYGSQFRAMGTALPTTTVISKTLYMGFIYNSTDTKWDLVAAAQEA